MTMTKEQMRQETANAIMNAKGVTLIKCPTKMAGGSDDRFFVHTRQAMKDNRKGK